MIREDQTRFQRSRVWVDHMYNVGRIIRGRMKAGMKSSIMEKMDCGSSYEV